MVRKLVLAAIISCFPFVSSLSALAGNEAAPNPAYVVVDFKVLQKDSLKTYGAAAKKTVKAHGGRFVAKGGINALYGEKTENKKVIIRFPSKNAALKWYNSPEYQKLIPIRRRGMDAYFHLVD